MPVEYEPLLRWRKARARNHEGIWGGPSRLARERPELVAGLLERVRREGPLSASDVTAPRERTPGQMWDWSDEKRALEWLFVTGQVHVATRRSSFERLYDVPERVLPSAILDAPTPPEPEAQAQLLLHAADALGVATLGDLADYFRMKTPVARPVLADLVAAGELVETAVEGWKQPAYVRPDLIVPRRIAARALLTPFDPVVWERSRAQRLFDFDYRIEIYTPATKRVLRVLRPALPAGRHPGRAGRSEGGSGARRADTAREGSVRRAGERPPRDSGRAGRRTRRNGALAGP